MQLICVYFRLYAKFQECFLSLFCLLIYGFQQNSVDLILQIVLLPMLWKTVYILNDDGIDIPIIGEK